MRRDTHHFLRRSILLALAISLASCTNENSMTQPPTQGLYTTPTGLLTANPPEILIGAGDIASCGTNNDELTAQIVDTIPGTVMVIGDNVYENGTTTEFNNCYHPTWGRHKARTKPATGNHEYNSSGATPYFNYFGVAAGTPGQGYYSYDLGAWHIIVLNSSISIGSGSAQDTWLQNDLATHPNLCTLSYFHHPLYSSEGGSGSGGVTYGSMRRPWDVMYPAGVDLVLGGHRHFYERMAPMKPDGSADPTTGIREIIVGSGGIGGGTLTSIFPRSEVRNGTTFGVLKLYLYDDSYAWRFIPKVGQTFTDSGSTACHGVPGSGGGGVSASNSTVSALPSSFTAGSGSSTITVTVNNSSGSPIGGANVVVSATGTGNTLTPSSGLTNSSGVFTSTFTSTGAGSKTVSASANGIGITQTAPVSVTAGPLSGTVSTVTASPPSFVAGAGSSTITVTAKDSYGNPISGATVVLASSGTGNTLTQPSGTTSTSGVATGTLGSTVAEAKSVSATINGTAITQTAPVTVTPPGSGGTITHALLTSGNNAANQAIYTTASITPAPNALITVAVLNHRSPSAISPVLSGGGMTSWSQVASADFDPISLPLKRLTVFRAMSPAPGSGPITITFTNSVANVQWIVSQWSGVETSGTNGAGAIGQTGSNRSDASSGLAVSLTPFGNPNNVAYGAVGVNKSVPTITPGASFTQIDEQPSAEGTAADLLAEWAVNRNTVDASWTGSLKAGLLAIEIKASGGGAPTVSASQSTVSASPASITAGGAPSTITVTVKDGSGTPMSGIAVTLSATGSGNNLTQPVGTTNGSGVATGTLSSTGAGFKTVTAVAGGVTLNQQPVVTVTAGAADAGQSTVAASPTSIAQTTGTSTITVTVKDEFGNPKSGSTVVVGATGSGNTITGPGATTDLSGVATAILSSTVAQGKTVSATADGTPITQTASVTVTPPSPTVSASLSTVAAEPTSFTAGGNSTITVTVNDGSGAPMSGISVTLSATGGGNITQPSSLTNGSGQTTGSFTSTGAGSKTITAVAGGVTLNQQPVVTVNAGSPDAGQSTVVAAPASITAGSGSSTITVTVKDQFGNLVNGSNVVLNATGTSNTLTGGGATTLGVATGTLSSTVAEPKIVSATADGTPITQTATVTVTAPGSGITHTLLTAGSNAVNINNYTTASISPAPNALITVAVRNQRSPTAISPTLSGGGMASWTQVASADYDPISGSQGRLTVFRAMSATPGSGPITITFTNSVANVDWIVSQWTGVDQSGTNGSGAIGQTGSARGDAVTALSVPLAAFGNANNVAYGVVGARLNAPAVTPGSGFTEIAEVTPGENTLLEAQWATNLNTIQASLTTAKNAALLGIEIKVAP